MPLPPPELTTLDPPPAIPDSTANDLVFAQFLDQENSSLESCYAIHGDLVAWINKIHDEIAATDAITKQRK